MNQRPLASIRWKDRRGRLQIGPGKPTSICCSARYNSNGTLDSGFGTGGITLTSVGGGDDEARAVAIQPDGRIVAAGHWQNGSNYDFALARFNADGSLDTSFGTGGKLTTAIGSSSEYARAVVVQADGRIVAAGFSNIAGTDDFALVRYNSDGTLDTSFGVGGKRTTSFGTGQDTAYALTLQPDGKLIAVGYSHNGSNYDFAVARYTTEGCWTLRSTPTVELPRPWESAVMKLTVQCLQSDGKLIVVGSSVRDSTYDLAVVRYHMELQLTQVSARTRFYNHSQYDNDSADASAADDAAIAMDKVALLPGSTATLGNYTSYSRGINGVIVDFANLASSTLVASDFLFRIGNDSSPGTWAIASAPTSSNT